MSVLPKEEAEDFRIRSRQQELDQRQFEGSPSQTSVSHQSTMDLVADPSGAPTPAAATKDLAALMAMMQEQACRQDEETLLIKSLNAMISKDLKVIKEKVEQHENRISEAEVQITGVKKALVDLKAG